MGLKLRRWYVHGDQMDGVPRLFYCAICERFIPGVHFRRSPDSRCRGAYDPRGLTFDTSTYHRAPTVPNLFANASLGHVPARRW